jgi:hypothetical protein
VSNSEVKKYRVSYLVDSNYSLEREKENAKNILFSFSGVYKVSDVTVEEIPQETVESETDRIDRASDIVDKCCSEDSYPDHCNTCPIKLKIKSKYDNFGCGSYWNWTPTQIAAILSLDK